MAKSKNIKPRRRPQPRTPPLEWSSDLAGDNEIPPLIDEAVEIIARQKIDKSRLKEIRDALGDKLAHRQRARGPGWKLYWYSADIPEHTIKAYKIEYANFRRTERGETGEVE